MVSFRTVIVSGGGSTAGIEVPEELVLGLGRGRRVPVAVAIGAYTYRSTVAPWRGAYMISLSAEHRAAAGVGVGDEVEVVLEVDDAPRTVEVPADLASALESAGLREAFDALSASGRKAHVLSVEGAKTAETRGRRVEGVLAKLRG